jgi:hypothetical protein
VWGLSSDAFFYGTQRLGRRRRAGYNRDPQRIGTESFYVLRSSDLQLQIIRWGLSSDVVKLGDYDGDGRTDAA